MDYEKIKEGYDILQEKIKNGEKDIVLDCQFCGTLVKLDDDSPVSYEEGDESFKTVCSECLEEGQKEIESILDNIG